MGCEFRGFREAERRGSDSDALDVLRTPRHLTASRRHAATTTSRARGRRSVFQEGIWRKREQKREPEGERERGRGGREREWETFSQEFKSSWLVVQQAEEQAAEISLVHHSDHPVSRCAQRVSIDRATPSCAQALSFSLTGVCLRPLEVGGSRLRCDSRRALSAASRGDAVAMVAQLERANGESMTRNI